MSRRYELQALCDALACSPDDLKARLGLDRRQVAAYLERGLTEARADQLAARSGLPAVVVWPEMIDHAIEDASVECADPRCRVMFVPRRAGHRYHTAECGNRHRWRERARRLYQSDPEWRARDNERARAWRAANARVVRVKNRAYYAANRERLLAWQREYHRRRKAA